MADSIKAIEMAKKQQDISIAEFFEKNRHLLGFDNKRKALLTTIKEAVDNSLDACEEARILPDIQIEIIDMGNERFRVIVEDNGPGIVKKQVPKIFAKLLYGSKFHKLSQSRGQQGIGISAAVLYSQLTTGRPAKITSRIDKNYPSHYYELHIDTKTNEPRVVADKEISWKVEHGTRIELDLEATYLKGDQSVDEYLKQSAIVNPHAQITYINPKSEQILFPRVSHELPKQTVEIKLHPYGVELGILIKMLQTTESRTLQSFLSSDFSRVGPGTAKEICKNGRLLTTMKPREMTRQHAEQLLEGIRQTKIIAPPTDCIAPIGEELVEKGLKKEINAEFYCATTRPPSVYSGNPFVIEAGIAYGGELNPEGTIEVLRFANRVPLLYQQGACAITESIAKTNWRPYGLSQSANALPQGPVVILVDMASVWVPFTSEAKEAIAHYPEIIREIKLAVQECGRKLALYVNRKRRVHDEFKKRNYIEMYIPHIAIGLKELLGLNEKEQSSLTEELRELLEKHRGKLESMEFDPSKNVEYDESLAKIGKAKGRKNDDEETGEQ